jgi:hypothetical protein
MMLAREHTTCATVPGHRHRSNTVEIVVWRMYQDHRRLSAVSSSMSMSIDAVSMMPP